MVDKINAFLQDPNAKSFNETFRMRNIFYWVGLPFFSIGILGLLNWPRAILKAFEKKIS